MKIYVDGELPECCNDCEFGYFYDCQYCSLRPDLAREDIWVEKEKYCPLQSLTDYTKQVRKEVCKEIRNWCDKNFKWVGDETGYDGQDYNEMIGSNNTINKLRELLDQIQDKGEQHG